MNEMQNCAKYLGHQMHQARCQYHIPIDEMASILNVPANILKKYEKGITLVPVPILERIFVIGYGFMALKRNNRHYKNMTDIYFKKEQNKNMCAMVVDDTVKTL